tara:strand:+ start:1513 stop:2016 length:504 start_codon:yes stop_codon:yes gene_type:complete
MTNIPDKIITGIDNGELNNLEKRELEVNITSSIMTFMSYSIKSSSIFVEHSERTIITTDDIKRAMMVEVFLYFERSDLEMRVGEWRNIILNEMKNDTSDIEDEEDEENDLNDEEQSTDKLENKEKKNKKICSCEVCDLMNIIKDKWVHYNPKDEMGKIFKKHIDKME